jgi:hypothetical protein
MKKSKKEGKKQKIKAWGVFSKWGFHRAYSTKQFALDDAREIAKIDGEHTSVYIYPITITY